MLQKVLSIAAGICLAITFLACGLGVCAGLPQVTEALALANSNADASPYPRDLLVRLACETRDFTVLDYGRATTGEDNATLAFAEQISQLVGKPYNALDERRFLDEGALVHLNDVHTVIAGAFWPIAGIALLAIVLLACVFVRSGRHAGGTVLFASGCAMLAFIAAVAVFAAFGFDAFFDAFHSLFFAEGSWTFAYDSLLICMYPIGFWIGMAVIWAATTAVLSLVAVIAGALLRKNSERPAASPQPVIGR